MTKLFICFTFSNSWKSGVKMETLSRREEQVLLAVWELQDNAYLLAVQKYLTEVTSKQWSVGIIHKPLLKLEKKGYISSTMGQATAKRGGRSKKLYKVTSLGIDELKALKNEQDVIWKNFLSREMLRENR